MNSISERVLWKEWIIKEKIGQGSFGDVYKAENDGLGAKRYTAVKHIALPKSENDIKELINQGFIKDTSEINEYYKDTINDITRECEIMYKLRDSENIVEYQDHIIQPKDDGIGYDIFIRMELLQSVDVYFKDRTITENDVIDLGIDICRALEACHSKGIIHRDIKSGNIFIDEYGNYKLGDFGVARQLEKTTYGMSKKGTYNYMAPEIYKGEEANLTADIYSLGIVLYRLLNNNRCPFLNKISDNVKFSENEEALLRRMSGESIPPIFSVDPELMKVILRAIEYDRKDRYQTVEEMKIDLQKVLDGEEIVVPEKANKKEESSLDRTVSLAEAKKEEDEKFKDENEIITDKKGRAEINYEKCSKRNYIMNTACMILFAIGLFLPTIKSSLTGISSFNTLAYNISNSIVILPLMLVLTIFAHKLSLNKRIFVKYAKIVNFINIGILTIFAKNISDMNLKVGTGFFIFLIANLIMIILPSKWTLGKKYVVVNSMFEKDIRKSLKLKKYYENEDSEKNKKKNMIFQIALSSVGAICLIICLVINSGELEVQRNLTNSGATQVSIKEATPIKQKQENANVFNKTMGIAESGELYTVLEKIEVAFPKYTYLKIKTENGIEGYINEKDTLQQN